MGHGSFNRLHI